MYTVVTIFLILTTCNTWTGKCEPPTREQWTVGIPEWANTSEYVAMQIEKCRIKGVKQALQKTVLFDSFGDNHGSTNVQCEFEIGEGT